MLQQSRTTTFGTGDTGVPHRPMSSTLDPSRATRVVARLRQRSLDHELIAGADPASSPRLAARAARLASTRERTLLAEGLERLLTASRGPQRRWSAVSRREPLLAIAAELSELAGLLRSSTPLYVRGMAIVHRLLTDGTGPAYLGSAVSLNRELRAARAAMGGHGGQETHVARLENLGVRRSGPVA